MNEQSTALKKRLECLGNRQRQLRFWSELTAAWTVAAFVGLVLAFVQRQNGWNSDLILLVIGFLAVCLAGAVLVRSSRRRIDLRQIARQVEARHPELEGRLLTAIQQEPRPEGELGYLQQRVIREAFQHSEQNDWAGVTPRSRVLIAQSAHFLSLVLLANVLMGLRVNHPTSFFARRADGEVTVSPGDTALERGSSLVVLTKFAGTLPPAVDLVLGQSPEPIKRVPLAKSLADPVFGGSVPEVDSNLVYHVEYAGKRTRDFKVKVFEYPRLERADAEINFPAYTGQPAKQVPDTRRVSAVEGSRVDLSMQLNKPVSRAQLVSRDKAQKVVPLQVETNRPVAALKELALESTRTYELQLVDAEGRTNKTPVQFVFEVVPNRPPEMRLTSPRGDIRPSPLEELSFDGTVWDDFGVDAYGLGYTVAGQDPKLITLGHGVPAKDKRTFHHTLKLEDLKLRADDLIAWFVWSEDMGPDGQPRRTSGDLFFGEVRPFEEIYREGQGGGQGQGGQQMDGNSPTAKLAELQKQIINATWKLQRQYGFTNGRQSSFLPENRRSAQSWSSAPRSNADVRRVSFLSPLTSQVAGQVSRDRNSTRSRDSKPLPRKTPVPGQPSYEDDVKVIRDALADALNQVEENSDGQQDTKSQALWGSAKKEMEKAMTLLDEAMKSPASLSGALSAEKAAYQALLKLQEHEFQVQRSRNQSQGGGSRDQQMQRQLEQLDFKQSDDRYETQRQAQPQQNPQRREDLQVMNRLQELARRQQDLNEKLKELQTALQEARTEKERQEIQRQLKRLQEDEQQLLADVDEMRQRMDREENQSRMSQQRQQLEQTREDVQKAAEQAGQGSPGQALASGIRAQRHLQEIREQMRKENANQFADDLREMRAQSRELERRQEDILNKLKSEHSSERKSLGDALDRDELQKELARQKQQATNLVERATQLSQQAEQPEPLLSRELYDTLRKFSQDTSKGVRTLQDALMNRGQMPRSLYERLKESKEPDSTKLMEITSEMLRQDLLTQAQESGQVAKGAIEEFKRGVERAAESVLGDDTEALRVAEEQLDRLAQEVQREMAQANGSSTNGAAAGNSQSGSRQLGSNEVAQAGQPGESRSANQNGQQGDPQQQSQPANAGQNGTQQGDKSQQPSDPQAGARGQQGGGQQGNQPGGQNSGQIADAQSANGQGVQRGDQRGEGQQRGNLAQRGGSRRAAVRNSLDGGGGGGEGADISGSLGRDLDRILDGELGTQAGPITGEGFTSWSDDLRDVEEMVEIPDLRNQVARVRERARLMRQEFKQDRKKPDWAVVQLEVMKPLAEVRDRISEELARRQSKEALVPIDRDPVPNRYSDLVRRYYEELGKER